MNKSIVLFFFISLALLAGSTSVNIYIDTPVYGVSDAINSSNYFTPPVFQVDDWLDTSLVKYYQYYRDEGCSTYVWSATYPHPNYYGADTTFPVIYTYEGGGSWIIGDLTVKHEKYGHWLDTISIEAINDSIWANLTNTWNNNIGEHPPRPERHQLKENLGNSVWNYQDSTISEIVTDYLIPVAGEYARILFPIQMGRYFGSFNWKTAVGPLDSAFREDARSTCGIDLPKRYSQYGLPEIIKICEAMGSKPNFVYTRISDTTYCVLDTFSFTYIDTFYDTLEITIVDTAIRRSLYDDAREFAEYLFGDTDSGWGKLRMIDGCTTAVNTDRIMIGNDLHSAVIMDIATEDQYLKEVGWPRVEITKALMDSGAIDFLDTSKFVDYFNYDDRVHHITLRLKRG